MSLWSPVAGMPTAPLGDLPLLKVVMVTLIQRHFFPFKDASDRFDLLNGENGSGVTTDVLRVNKWSEAE